jgi:TolB-like protein
LGWAFRNGYEIFTRLPRWIRLVIIVWAVIAVFSRGHDGRDDEREAPPVPPNTQKKIDAIANQYKKNPSTDLAKLGAMVAEEFGKAMDSDGVSVLALPFAAPDGGDDAAKLAESAFAQSYTRLSVVQHAKLLSADTASSSCAPDKLLALGSAKNVLYVICGLADAPGPAQALTVTLVQVKRHTLLWSGKYPIADADPAKIALDVSSRVPMTTDNDD